jgi:hypothetical protein
MHAGATRMDKRSINVEKKQALLRYYHVFSTGSKAFAVARAPATQTL